MHIPRHFSFSLNNHDIEAQLSTLLNLEWIYLKCTWHDSFKFLALDTIFNHAKEENLINGGHIVHSKISVSFYGTHLVIPSSNFLGPAARWLAFSSRDEKSLLSTLTKSFRICTFVYYDSLWSSLSGPPPWSEALLQIDIATNPGSLYIS